MSERDETRDAAEESALEATDILGFSPARVSISTWAASHARAFVATTGLLARTPIATGLTAAVIGVALALPLGLFLVVDSLAGLTEQWDRGAQLSVFLKPAVSDAQAGRIAKDLNRWPATESVRVLSRADVLTDFEGITGLKGLVDAFGADNPLPAVLVVSAPGRLTETSTRPALQALAAKLRALTTVDFVEFDTDWLTRARAVLGVLHRGAAILAVLLGTGLLLVVSNVVGVMVERRREEIEVSRLCGATDAFIRRPFLYSGVLLGALGAVLGWCVLKASGSAMSMPLQSLAALYPTTVKLPSLGLVALLGLMAAGAGIGVLGAWLAVGRQLRTMEP